MENNYGNLLIELCQDLEKCGFLVKFWILISVKIHLVH